MEKLVKISPWQKVTTDDYNKFGTFPRASFDTIVEKTLIPDLAFEGFAVTQTGPTEVTVAPGHLWSSGKVYVNDSTGGTSINMSAHLPAATRRIIVITAYGSENDAKLEARTYLTDAETRATVARETATENWRWANIASVSGIEGPDPQAPALAANVCPLAYVTLATTGVESILRAEDYVVPTLRECDNRLNVFDIWKIAIGSRIDTLASDLLALAARIFGLAKADFVHKLAQDLARTKDVLRLPDAYTAWGADHFLTEAKSDKTHADWLCFIDEGVRFSHAAEEVSQLGLLNPFDELVINSNSVVLPTWTPFTRITNKGSDNELSVSQYEYQTVAYVQKTLSRTRTRYGPVYKVCSNTWWWDAEGHEYQGGFVGQADLLTMTFLRDTGDVYNILRVSGEEGHYIYRLQQVWIDTYLTAYWDVVVTTSSIAGAMIGQTFVNSQDGWLCEVDLFFSRVAASGNVTVLLCETTNGAPDVNKVLATSVRAPVDMHLSAKGQNVGTTFAFQPTFLTKGRYAFVIITGGNHYVWTLQDTNYVSGTLFYNTDAGGWFQGDLTKDLSFEARFCRFINNQSRVQLINLNLQNGIAAIDVNARSFAPPGCLLYYEAQKDGVWHPLTANSDITPDVLFIGLPPNLPFRAVFIGTEWVQPALGVASNSRVRTWRPRSDFTHISEIRTPGAAITTLTCDIRVESWRGTPIDITPAVGSNHRLDMKLMSGGGYATLTSPTTISVEVAPDDPTMPGGGMIIHYTWTGLASLTSYRFKLIGNTDNVLTTFHVAERIDVAQPA